MKACRMLAAAACLACFEAGALTGNQALEAMTGSREAEAYFAAYMLGMTDAEFAARLNGIEALASGGKPLPTFCPPAGANASQTAAMVIKELKASPENNHEELFVIARRTLLRAWPCDDSWAKKRQ